MYVLAIQLKSQEEIDAKKINDNKDIYISLKQQIIKEHISYTVMHLGINDIEEQTSFIELVKIIKLDIKRFKPSTLAYDEIYAEYRALAGDILSGIEPKNYEDSYNKESNIVVYIMAIIYLNISEQAFSNQDYKISISFYQKYTELKTIYRYSKGYTWQQIIDDKPTPIKKHTDEKKEIAIPLAKKIWGYDKDTNLLMRRQVATLVVDLLPDLGLTIPQVDNWLNKSKATPQAILDRYAIQDYGNTREENELREQLKSKILRDLSPID